MRHEFSMPDYKRIEGESHHTSDIECAVEIEADEAAALASWYIARCFLQVSEKNTTKWVPVPTGHPMFETISLWAHDECEQKLEQLWEAYLDDKPRRMRPNTDREEHGTYWGRP